MKKLFFFSLVTLLSTVTYAKKVKFAVDMTGQTVSVNGVHVTGDFQLIAGYPADWESNTTLLTLEDSATAIYSIVLDLPAFAKYEYKFINGDQFYEAEFVPVESRVGYDFDDNRWLYVDSLGNDTTCVGAILFAGNAPLNKLLVRYYVDMQNETVSANGIHVGTDYELWSPTSSILYNFQGSIYEVIGYVDTGAVNYNFINGNAQNNTEVLSDTCTSNGIRSVLVNTHILLPTVCFASCSACVSTAGIPASTIAYSIAPNPVNDLLHIESEEAITSVTLFAANGTKVQSIGTINATSFDLQTNALLSGVYFIQIGTQNGLSHVSKVIKN
jgi:hypothetical protein